MDIIQIYNGLGNQMSQYAFFLAKKKYTNKVLAFYKPNSSSNHNGYELEDIFGIRLCNNVFSKILSFLCNCASFKRRKRLTQLIGIRSIACPKTCNYCEKLLLPGPKGINFYIGGWHSEKYFIQISEEIKHVFSFPRCCNDTSLMYWENLILNTKNSISIHIRRGDYLNSCFDEVCTEDYYLKAISYLQSRIRNCSFFVFSDDIDYCKTLFNEAGFLFIDCNKGKDSWKDMYLSSLCTHHIVANSTFSWWGAWLGQHSSGITIRPKWFIRDIATEDFYPDNWITIEYN